MTAADKPQALQLSKGIVHAIFRCQVCGKEWTDYLTSQKAAAKHAKELKHYVTGEVAYFVTYGEKK